MSKFLTWDTENVGSSTFEDRHRVFDTDTETFTVTKDVDPTRYLYAHSVVGGVVFFSDYSRTSDPPYDGLSRAELRDPDGERVWLFDGTAGETLMMMLGFASDGEGRVWMAAGHSIPGEDYLLYTTLARMNTDGAIAESVVFDPRISGDQAWFGGDFVVSPDASVAVLSVRRKIGGEDGDSGVSLVGVSLTDGSVLWQVHLSELDDMNHDAARIAWIPGEASFIVAGPWKLEAEDSDLRLFVARYDFTAYTTAPTEAWATEFDEANDSVDVDFLCVNTKCAVFASSSGAHTLWGYNLEGTELWTQTLPSGFFAQGVQYIALTEDHLCVSVYEFGIS